MPREWASVWFVISESEYLKNRWHISELAYSKGSEYFMSESAFENNLKTWFNLSEFEQSNSETDMWMNESAVNVFWVSQHAKKIYHC